MPYSIGLYFDQETDLLIRKIWTLLDERKFGGYYHQSGNRPHLTLSIFNDVDISKAAYVLEHISQSLNPFSLSFQQIGLFPGPDMAIFWGPVVTKELLEIHSHIYKLFCEFSTQPDFNFYTPGHWIPHCGLAMEIKNYSVVPQIIELCQTLPNPHIGWVTEIGLISF